MTFSTQSAAKRFFVDKIVAQADHEGAPLSNIEREMLAFSESDPEFITDPVALSARLNEEETDEEYEAKVAGLIERSFRKDAASDPRLRQQWSEARSALAQGDHYLLVMIDRALGRPAAISGGSALLSVFGKSARILFGGLAVLLAGATALTGLLVGVSEGFGWGQMPAFAMSIVLLALGVYLIRTARRSGAS